MHEDSASTLATDLILRVKRDLNNAEATDDLLYIIYDLLNGVRLDGHIEAAVADLAAYARVRNV